MATLPSEARPCVDTDMSEETEHSRPHISGQPKAPISIVQEEWMTAEQEAELEEELFELGKRKYGFDEGTAREWAHAFCSGDEDSLETSRR